MGSVTGSRAAWTEHELAVGRGVRIGCPLSAHAHSCLNCRSAPEPNIRAVQVRILWEDASAAAGRPLANDDEVVELGRPGPPDPALASTPEEFIVLMRRLRAWAGNPSLKTLNQRSGGYLLPPATVSEALRRQRLPRRRELLSAYVRACGLTDEQAQA
jgi:hypothetical protein